MFGTSADKAEDRGKAKTKLPGVMGSYTKYAASALVLSFLTLAGVQAETPAGTTDTQSSEQTQSETADKKGITEQSSASGSETSSSSPPSEESTSAPEPADNETAAASKPAESGTAAESGKKTDRTKIRPSVRKELELPAPSPVIAWESSFRNVPIKWIAVSKNKAVAGSLFTSLVAAYDLGSGAFSWSNMLPKCSPAPPLDVENMLVFASMGNTLTALDAVSGEIKFTCLPFPYDKLLEKPAAEPDKTEAGDDPRAAAKARTEQRQKEQEFNRQLLRSKLSLNPQLSCGTPMWDGSSIITFSRSGFIGKSDTKGNCLEWHMLPDSGLCGRGFYSSPLLLKSESDTAVYAVCSDGDLWTIDVDYTALSESQKLSKSRHEFRAPVLAKDNILYMISAEGAVFCLAVDTRDVYPVGFVPKLLWKFNSAPVNAYQINKQGELINNLCLSEDRPSLFFASQRKIWALRSRNGRQMWVFPPASAPAVPVKYWKGWVIAALENGSLIFINSETGEKKYSFKLPFVPSGGMTVNGDSLLIGSRDGRIVRINMK